MRWDIDRNTVLRISAAAGGVLLLLFVFFLTSGNQGRYAGEGKTELPQLQQEGKIPLISSDKTNWSYLDEGQEEIVKAEEEKSWRENGYHTRNWKTASGSFGAKDGEKKEMGKGNAPNNLLIQYDLEGNSSPVFLFRTELTIANPDSIQTLAGEMEFDDAALLYINGELVWAGNNPDGGYESLMSYGAKEAVSSPRAESFIIKDTSMLKKGKNTVAVEIHQNYSSGSDVFFHFEDLTGYSSAEEAEELDTSGLVLETGEDENSVRVNWYTKERGAFELQHSLMKDGKAEETYAAQLMGRQKGETQGAYCYTASLVLPEPDREYVYRIKRIGSKDMSGEYTFTGAKPGEEFTFLFAGDPQIGAGDRAADGILWEETLTKSLSLVPDAEFLISAGDQTDSSDEEEARLEYMEFRRPEILKRLPLAVNIGNHEAENNLYEKQFKREGQKGLEYSFVYKNVLFVALDLFSDNPEGQAEYLQDEIADHPAKWVVVTLHYSLFSAGSHAYDESIVKRRELLAPVFSQCNVDLVLAGHDHSYTRTFYMNGLESSGRTEGKKNSGEVLYLTGGSSTGNKYYEKNKEDVNWDAFFLEEKVPVITAISVTGESLEISTYNLENSEKIDFCRMEK